MAAALQTMLANLDAGLPVTIGTWPDAMGSALFPVFLAGIMHTLQVSDRPTKIAQALAEFGRIEKTLHATSPQRGIGFKVRLAVASIGQAETTVGNLCREVRLRRERIR